MGTGLRNLGQNVTVLEGEIAGNAGEAGKVLKADDASLAALIATGHAEVVKSPPAKGSALGRLYILESGSKYTAIYLGQGSGNEPLLVADLTGTPADGSVTAAKVAAANIDGAVGTPSLRTLLTAITADNTHAPTAEAVKSYVDAAIQGLSVKPSAALATTEALPENTYANGTAGVGATLTAKANGALQLDPANGVEVGDVILVKNEAEELKNGLYTVTQKGSASLPYILTRHVDMDQAAEFDGAFVFVEGGTVNKGSGWVVASKAAVTVGTSAIKWTQFSGAGEITAEGGLSKSGNALSIATAGVTQSKVGDIGFGSRFGAEKYTSGSGSITPGEKTGYWIPVRVFKSTLNGVVYQVGATKNGNVIVSAYNPAGTTLLGTSAATEQGTAEQPHEVKFEVKVELAEPQIIWVFIEFSSATGTCMGAFNIGLAKRETAMAEFKAPANFVLPTTPLAGVKIPFLSTF